MSGTPNNLGAFLTQQQHVPYLPPAIRTDAHPNPTHCGINLNSFYVKSSLALLPPLAAGAVLFGWRALAAVGIVLASSLAGTTIWRFVGQRGRSLHWTQAVQLSLLLSFLVPAELARANDGVGIGYTLLVAAGLTLSSVYWVLGGLGARLHPVAVTALLLLGLFQTQMTPTSVLSRKFLFRGDVLQSSAMETTPSIDPILSAPPTQAAPALRIEPASSRLSDFTRGRVPSEGASAEAPWLSLDTLIRDRLPPLEDLIVGGHPAPLGLGSLGAIFLGGLFLLRNGVSWRIPTIIIVTAFVCFLTFRLPIVVTPAGPVYRWLAIRTPGVTWESLITFALYQMAAGPLVFTAFFLAPAGPSRPTSPRGQAVYAMLIGAAAAAGQLYISVPIGPLLALATMSLASPVLERMFHPKPLL